MVNAEILNNNLQGAIRNKLPKGTNIANALADILFIGKEAVYRRLRGEVPFSLYESALIVKHFGISLDSIINTATSGNAIFELKDQRFYDLSEADYSMLEEYLGVLKFAQQEPYSEQVYTSNVFPQFPSHLYSLLTKYNSFRWMYLNYNLSMIKTFHEMDYPERLSKTSKEIIDETMNIKDTSYIWDSSIFQSIVKEIQYFHNIRLINKEDLADLRDELLELLDLLESIASKGKFETGNKVHIYISNINSEAVYSYLETPHIHLSMIGALAMNYVVSLEPKTLLKLKERIHSLKRVSTLISESGEIQRVQFFKTQRETVNTLTT